MMQVLLASTDLMVSSMLEGATRAAGAELTVVRSVGAVTESTVSACRLAVIDLSSNLGDLPTLVQQLRGLAPEAQVVAFGPHVHADRLQQARDAGCDVVMTRGQFHQQAGALVSSLCAA